MQALIAILLFIGFAFAVEAVIGGLVAVAQSFQELCRPQPISKNQQRKA